MLKDTAHKLTQVAHLIQRHASTGFRIALGIIQDVHYAASRFIRTQKGKMITVGLFTFAIGAFISKLTFIEDWRTLVGFMLGGALGVGSTLIAVYFDDIK